MNHPGCLSGLNHLMGDRDPTSWHWVLLSVSYSSYFNNTTHTQTNTKMIRMNINIISFPTECSVLTILFHGRPYPVRRRKPKTAPGIPEPTKQSREGNGPIGRRAGLYLVCSGPDISGQWEAGDTAERINHRIAKDNSQHSGIAWRVAR